MIDFSKRQRWNIQMVAKWGVQHAPARPPLDYAGQQLKHAFCIATPPPVASTSSALALWMPAHHSLVCGGRGVKFMFRKLRFNIRGNECTQLLPVTTHTHTFAAKNITDGAWIISLAHARVRGHKLSRSLPGSYCRSSWRSMTGCFVRHAGEFWVQLPPQLLNSLKRNLRAAATPWRHTPIKSTNDPSKSEHWYCTGRCQPNDTNAVLVKQSLINSCCTVSLNHCTHLAE